MIIHLSILFYLFIYLFIYYFGSMTEGTFYILEVLSRQSEFASLSVLHYTKIQGNKNCNVTFHHNIG